MGGELRSGDMVELGELNEHAAFIEEVSLSEAFDRRSAAAKKVPSSIVRNTYVCSKNANNQYTLKRAIEMPESKPVVLCNTESCNGLSLGRVDKSLMKHIKDSALVKLWK